MGNKEIARQILQELKMPVAQQSDVCCYSLLAIAGIAESAPWVTAHNEWIRIHDIIHFTYDCYDVRYAENSRETFRKQALHHFRNAAIIEDNGEATNSPNYRYRLTDEALWLLRQYGSIHWNSALQEFSEHHLSLIDLYASKKMASQIPVVVNGNILGLTTGKHNQLQRAILEEFAPRFAPYSECLYIGDTAAKDLYKDTAKLQALGFTITLHDKMPDVVLYRPDCHWLYFIEAVTSVGPMNPKRIIEIQEMTIGVSAGIIFVTAFLDFRTFKRFSETIAWETEVWIADNPEHMIHLNGDRFMGPRGA